MSQKKLLYVFSSAPYSHADGQEGLDALLIGAAFDQCVSVLFLHDGVFQIKRNQQTDNSGLKQYGKTFAGLADFGVEHVYVHDASLVARGLSVEDLSIKVDQLNSAEVSDLIKQQFRVLTF